MEGAQNQEEKEEGQTPTAANTTQKSEMLLRECFAAKANLKGLVENLLSKYITFYKLSPKITLCAKFKKLSNIPLNGDSTSQTETHDNVGPANPW